MDDSIRAVRGGEAYMYDVSQPLPNRTQSQSQKYYNWGARCFFPNPDASTSVRSVCMHSTNFEPTMSHI